jgi:hypothetical protein
MFAIGRDDDVDVFILAALLDFARYVSARLSGSVGGCSKTIELRGYSRRCDDIPFRGEGDPSLFACVGVPALGVLV